MDRRAPADNAAAAAAVAPEVPAPARRLTDREAHEGLARYITRNSADPTTIPAYSVVNEMLEGVIQGRIREALRPMEEELERLRRQVKRKGGAKLANKPKGPDGRPPSLRNAKPGRRRNEADRVAELIAEAAAFTGDDPPNNNNKVGALDDQPHVQPSAPRTRLTTRAASAASALANFEESEKRKREEEEKNKREMEENARKENERKRARRDGENSNNAARNSDSVSNFSGSLLVLTVSPGRLGLALSIDPEGGARVVDIYEKDCTLASRVSVGDRIVTIDGKRVKTMNDIREGNHRVRKFCIIKEAGGEAKAKKLLEESKIEAPPKPVIAAGAGATLLDATTSTTAAATTTAAETAATMTSDGGASQSAGNEEYSTKGRMGNANATAPPALAASATKTSAAAGANGKSKPMESETAFEAATSATATAEANPGSEDARKEAPGLDEAFQEWGKHITTSGPEEGDVTLRRLLGLSVAGTASTNDSCPRNPAGATEGSGRKEGVITTANNAVNSTKSEPAFFDPSNPHLGRYKSCGRRQTFRILTHLKAAGTDQRGGETREELLTELLQWDKQNKVNTKVKISVSQFQVLLVPLTRFVKEGVKLDEKRYGGSYENQRFDRYSKQYKFMDKFLDAWATYCGGSQDDAADMVLFWLAKKFPNSYVKNHDTAKEKLGPLPPQLPPDFVSFDGTNDVRWNAMYAELAKYRTAHGHCQNLHSKVEKVRSSELGKWVSIQRTRKKDGNLSEKRIELLDGLDFVWDATPEGWARAIPGGDPRLNRAVAAKLVYPCLSIREALHLGGFEEEELNVVKDPKHSWRTIYVVNKDKVARKVKTYETARRTGARIQIEKLVDILRSEDEDRFEQVFGDKSHLLPYFLEASEERITPDVEEKPSMSTSRKRSIDEGCKSDSDEEQRQEDDEMLYGSHTESINEVDLQAPMV